MDRRGRARRDRWSGTLTGTTPTPSTGHARQDTVTSGWEVRPATGEDAAAIAAAVSGLLEEIGGTPPPRAAMEETTRALLLDADAGTLLVAEAYDGALVGVLSASWQSAIHIPGRYGLIQDLWVDPSWRSRRVGASLLVALAQTARELGVLRIEVGLPRDSFAKIRSTERFYAANGFESLGRRMRRLRP